MLELVAQGDGSNTGLLQSATDRSEGSGVIEFELDTEFVIPIPGPEWLTGPDRTIKIGLAIRLGIKALELTLKAIPGVHLDQGIQFTERNGRGTLPIAVRNNPVPVVLGAVVAAILPTLLAIGALVLVIILLWRLLKGAVGKTGTTIIVIVILVVAAVAVLVFAGGGKLSGFKPHSLGG